ncbi:type IX secretion system plug protein [Bergeyella sp. RCAD1439]|uniref:type IX secretion system plug protein n=1 Tax=Bergeyella anatis TaxID=3113737 RepID=UPI002E19EE77|nr:type IX secretion system plug protein domain-containing protein [Bergeyella sp. RCAD1439]
MKRLLFLMLCLSVGYQAQDLRSIQLFNPQTNDQTPVIRFDERLILRFDDLSNASTIFRYTLKHYDRNWGEDGLFYTEFAEGPLNGLIDQMQYSFNTSQPYTHYTLEFPNDKIRPKISGNYEIVVYKDSPQKPLFSRRFCVVEDGASLALNLSRINNSKNPEANQRLEVAAIPTNDRLNSNLNSLSLSLIQNNNWNSILSDRRPSSSLGNRILFQQMDLVFPGYNEFYYFDNKNLTLPADMVAHYENDEGVHHTYLHPVWAFPLNYQYQPDVNGAFYFRRNDMGIERNADKEADYTWVHFALESDPVDRNLYVLGGFNNYQPSEENQMHYDEKNRMYTAKIYLKQGFYNYLLGTTSTSDGKMNLGEINGNFWQTENLYQAFLYYRPFNRNYDGLIGYGELRPPVR